MCQPCLTPACLTPACLVSPSCQQVIQGAPSNAGLVNLLFVLRKGTRPSLARQFTRKLGKLATLGPLGRASRSRLEQAKGKSAEVVGSDGLDCGDESSTTRSKAMKVGEGRGWC